MFHIVQESPVCIEEYVRASGMASSVIVGQDILENDVNIIMIITCVQVSHANMEAHVYVYVYTRCVYVQTGSMDVGVKK